MAGGGFERPGTLAGEGMLFLHDWVSGAPGATVFHLRVIVIGIGACSLPVVVLELREAPEGVVGVAYLLGALHARRVGCSNGRKWELTSPDKRAPVWPHLGAPPGPLLLAHLHVHSRPIPILPAWEKAPQLHQANGFQYH